jgi:hypothetical protein
MQTTTEPTLCDRAAEIVREARADGIDFNDLLVSASIQHTESPIEQVFAVAYATILFDGPQLDTSIKWNRQIDLAPLLADDLKSMPYRPFTVDQANVVIPQCKLPQGRVDFVLLRWLRDVERLRSPLVRSPMVIVECDGHEYHERTPKQAERDRSRDRAFQAAGHTVLRFTGRELWRDPYACVDQVDDFLNGVRPKSGT